MTERRRLVRTRQRQVLLEELRKLKCHPTADELYAIVREVLPRISLGTVYRNLEILCEQGLARKVRVAGARKRFDGNCGAHSHIRCRDCGRVDDVPEVAEVQPQRLPVRLAGYRVLGAAIEFEGLCPVCSPAEEECEAG